MPHRSVQSCHFAVTPVFADLTYCLYSLICSPKPWTLSLLVFSFFTLRISDSMSRQPQVKAGCCSCATCSSLLAKAATLLVLTSPFMALKSRDRNIGDLPDLATSGCNSTAYSALRWWTSSQCWSLPRW